MPINIFKGWSGIGFHYVFDGMSDDESQGFALEYLKDLKPAVVNVVGGARKEQAIYFADKIVKGNLAQRVIFRNWPDDGNWKRHPYYGNPNGSKLWVEHNRHLMDYGFSVLTDNESNEGDFSGFINFQVGIIEELARISNYYMADFGRQPTGTPGDGTGGSSYQYNQFDRLYRALSSYPNGRFSLSPNEYVRWDEVATSGMTARFSKHLERSRLIKTPLPSISIGEFGTAYMNKDGTGLDPYAGYSHEKIGMNGVNYVNHLVNVWRVNYRPFGVPFAIYCWGDSLEGRWGSFRLDRDRAALERLIAQKDALIIPPLTSEYTLVQSGDTDRPKFSIEFQVTRLRPYINLRKQPNTASAILSTVNNGEVVTVISSTRFGRTIWYQVRKVNGLTGYISDQMGVIKVRRI